MSVVLAITIALGLVATPVTATDGEPRPLGGAGLLGLAAGAAIVELIEPEAPPQQEWRDPPVLARPSPDRDFLLDVFTLRPGPSFGRPAR